MRLDARAGSSVNARRKRFGPKCEATCDMNRTLPSLVVCAALLAACSKDNPPTDTTQTTGAATRADNTEMNQRDRNGATLTPIDQSNTRQDIQTTAAIRKTLVDDSTLSMNAKNVKIITQDGTVTLRGTVDSADEKSAIENDATQTASAKQIVNDLDVATK